MKASMCVRVAAAAAAVASLAGIAAGGPDVIVGELVGTSNYGTQGTKAAFAVGTTSCNIGNAPLSWISNTNNHPVISQNIYRLSNGRFQQIGQAWLKHGFCALQGNVCSTCTPGGTCAALFPGCSDPYSSGLNGDQGGLGPKSEVNAFTGAFPYPWVNNGSGSGTAFKRLQADVSTLGTSGASYFVSSMYVQPEDAASGNALNNQSYRPANVAFSGGQWNLSLTGSTQREKPALQAWKDADAAVQIANFNVPGEGRFIVAMRATNIGGGNWHYEYAIQNFNSDRSGQAFTIPVPAGTVIGNIGFSDVDYHSGEPYSGTDWTSGTTSTSITWQTQTHATNANANALRWDTIYNFWFDANIAPGAGSATIALFKPGSPTSISGNIQVPGGAGGPVAPANDACANAASLGNAYGSFPFDNANATTDGPSETLCSNNQQCYNDIWYTWTACSSGSVTVSTCGANFDTKVAIYSAACPSAANTAIACNDDSSACGSGSLQSSVSFSATSGTTYRIRVGSYYNNQTQGQGFGSGNLVITGPSCGPAAPANDACANATVISGYGSFPFTTSLATTDGPTESVCNFFGYSQVGADVWFRWTACAAGTVTLDICDANYDSKIAVYPGTCPTATGTAIACNDDACGTSNLRSRLTFTAAAGTQYLVRIGGFNALTGSGNLLISGPACAPPGPANDNCANREGVAGSLQFSTVGATTDGPAHPLCSAFGYDQVGADIWYNHPSSCPGALTIEVCNSSYDTKIAVYDDAGCTNLEQRIMACNDDACGTGGLRSRVIIPARAGRNYTIRIGGFQAATGTGTLSITCCQADFDASGTVEVSDIFAFLAAWFGGDPRADYTGTGGNDVPDIFAFLSAWFAGCP
ncbi:MAG: hypothetical protein KF699_11305 [Phycisphaeraceae bacterium]|nr:hypothetical protein [Phycisphaeraceae bacterium]